MASLRYFIFLASLSASVAAGARLRHQSKHAGHTRRHLHSLVNVQVHRHHDHPPSKGIQVGQFYTDEQQHIIEKTWQEEHGKVLKEISALKETEFEKSALYVQESPLGPVAKLLWDFFPPIYPCPLLWQIGRAPMVGDGAKYICGAQLLSQQECVVYSFGSNGEVTFEKEMIEKAGCDVHIFDPTLSEEQKQQVREIQGVQLHDYGISGIDGEVAVNTQFEFYYHEQLATIPVKTLPTIMQELGHTWIDVLKVDIEGAEYDFLEGYTQSGTEIPATQLQVEFHQFHTHQTESRRIFDILSSLTSAGNMRPFHYEPNLWWNNDGREFVEYAFLHVDNSTGAVKGPWVGA